MPPARELRYQPVDDRLFSPANAKQISIYGKELLIWGNNGATKDDRHLVRISHRRDGDAAGKRRRCRPEGEAIDAC